MKLNLSVTSVLAVLGAAAGLSHDLGSYRDACNKAKASGQPAPVFDWVSTLHDVLIGISTGLAGAISVSQLPGT